MKTAQQKNQATPEEIWNILREVSKNQKETDRQFKETDRQFKETALQFKRTDKRLKQLSDLFHGKWGVLIETLVRGDLIKLLNERGISAGHTLTNLKKEHGKQKFEFDILAVNGSEVVVVEVKTILRVRDVDYFLEKMSCFTDFVPEYKGKKIYGAMAYLKANQSSNINAEDRGLFVIRALGNSASILNKQSFRPKVFGS